MRDVFSTTNRYFRLSESVIVHISERWPLKKPAKMDLIETLGIR